MNKLLLLLFSTILGVFILANLASASPTSDLQPASTVTYNEELVVNDTGRFNSVYIGKQGVGGVTFFNGTIVNNTTDPDTGAPISVTFGDNVRIDGYLHGGPSLGYTDDNVALKIGDNVYPGLDNKNDFGKATHRWRDAHFAGNVTVGNLQGSAVIHPDNLATTNSASTNQVLSYNGSNLEWVTVGSSDGGDGDSGDGGGGITVGDITAVNAGTGLTGGGDNGAVTLNVDEDRYVNVSGDTMTGKLIVGGSSTTENSGIIEATNSANTGTAVYGKASGTGLNFGGYFKTDSDNGVGVEGRTGSSGGTGVFGRSLSTDAHSGYFTGGNFTVNLTGDSNFTLGSLGTGNGEALERIAANGHVVRVVSSRRYKENIEKLEVKTADVLKLQPVSFNYIETGQEDVGLIAEDVNEIIPELVNLDKEGRPNSVEYDKVSIYLLEVIKEQQEEINNLKNIICEEFSEKDICN